MQTSRADALGCAVLLVIALWFVAVFGSAASYGQNSLAFAVVVCSPVMGLVALWAAGLVAQQNDNTTAVWIGVAVTLWYLVGPPLSAYLRNDLLLATLLWGPPMLALALWPASVADALWRRHAGFETRLPDWWAKVATWLCSFAALLMLVVLVPTTQVYATLVSAVLQIVRVVGLWVVIVWLVFFLVVGVWGSFDPRVRARFPGLFRSGFPR